MTDLETIRKWLIDSRGQQMPDGSPKWAEIARRSRVSPRTLSNICNTSKTPRPSIQNNLDAVRKRMERK